MYHLRYYPSAVRFLRNEFPLNVTGFASASPRLAAGTVVVTCTLLFRSYRHDPHPFGSAALFRPLSGIGARVALLLMVAGSAQAQSTAPQFLYTAEIGTPQIFGFQLNTTTGALTPIRSSPFNERRYPTGMAVKPGGTSLFVANGNGYNSVSVFAINPTTGLLISCSP
jgi:hypothetical protein